MRNDGVESLLLGKNEDGASSLLRQIPVGPSNPLALLLENSECAVFYSCPVEDGCWWVPLTGPGRKCLGARRFAQVSLHRHRSCN
jgi:hypothetical protein